MSRKIDPEWSRGLQDSSHKAVPPLAHPLSITIYYRFDPERDDTPETYRLDMGDIEIKRDKVVERIVCDPTPEAAHPQDEELEEIFERYKTFMRGDVPNFRRDLRAYVDRQRVDELSKVWGGMNDAAWKRTPVMGTRDLNLDDLSFYLHNRRRELDGKKLHTPDEWFEAER